MAITLTRIASRQATVGIIGLGYVGLPLSLTVSEAGFAVIGFDTDAAKVAALDAGSSYIRQIPAERVARARTRAPGFSASTDLARASVCDAVIICVPTPLDEHLAPDLGYIERTCEALAPRLSPGTLVVLESTTWPGTTVEVVRPILERLSAGRGESGEGLRLGRDLYLAFSPEREDPGNARFDTRSIPKLVGGADAASLELAVALYKAVVATVVPVDGTQVAEAAKLLENIFRSVNIALVNELKMIFDRMGIDIWQVIAAASTKPFGFMPFHPGPGMGGHCIPIDPYYLTWRAKQFGIDTRFIELAGEINRAMPAWVVGKVALCLNDVGKAIRGSRILVLGLAYKADVDDIRESPSFSLIALLEAQGATVDYHDPYVPVIPPTREHAALAGRASKPLSKDYDCFLLATGHRLFDPSAILAHGVPVVDTRNKLPRGPGVYPA